jgi:hypothetical protein
MKIQIEKSKDHYRADCLDLSGAPPVGLGNTPEMAVACLFYRMMFENAGGGNNRHNWLYAIKKDEPIIVNNETWDWPESYRKCFS